MSVKLRLSYETDDELAALLIALDGQPLYVKEAPQRGQYKRCYLEGETLYTPAELAEFQEGFPDE